MSSQQLFPRVRNRIRFTVGGIISGLVGGLGFVILLQQMAVLIPTRTALIAGPVLGVVVSIALNTAGRTLGTRRLNKKITQAEATVLEKEAAGGGVVEPAAEGWFPTHVIPDGGLPAWETPDGSAEPASQVDAGLEVQLVEQRGDWAQVSFSNGWTGWVDARRLIAK